MNTVVVILVTFLLFESYPSSKNVEWELELVQLVLRNGISAPKELYPNDPNDPEAWEDGLDQLTMMGKKQMYAIGEELKKRYREFLSDDPQEVIVRSAFNDKCMNSALCLLASLYEPTPSWEFIKDLHWQPIPIQYVPPYKDQMLGSLNKCPPVNKVLETLENMNSSQAVNEMYKKQLNYWSYNSGMTVKTWKQASDLYEILSAEYANDDIIPEWAWKYWEDLERLNKFAYKIIYSNPTILRFVGGPLLNIIVGNAAAKSVGLRFNLTKIIIYSGQSEHVAGVMGAMKIFNDKAPSFASSVLMELFRRKDQGMFDFDYRIKFSFLDATGSHVRVDTPRTLVFPGCDELCPLDYVFDNTEQWENPSWTKYCTK